MGVSSIRVQFSITGDTVMEVAKSILERYLGICPLDTINAVTGSTMEDILVQDIKAYIKTTGLFGTYRST